MVEDDSFTRATLGDALVLAGFEVKARVATAAAALSAQDEFAPQVAVLDLDLGIGPTGIDVAIALRRKNPQIGIIFLTTYKDPRLMESNLPSLPEGAIYLNKLEITSTSTIFNQISAALLKPLMRRSIPWGRDNKLSPLSTFSILQIEIMKEIAKGTSTSEMAKVRGVSEQAIDKSISQICKKLGILKTTDSNHRVAIVRAYFENKGQGV